MKTVLYVQIMFESGVVKAHVFTFLEPFIVWAIAKLRVKILVGNVHLATPLVSQSQL